MHAAPKQTPRAPVPPMLPRAAPLGLKGTVAAAESKDKKGAGRRPSLVGPDCGQQLSEKMK
jgi:hypothetical protein